MPDASSFTGMVVNFAQAVGQFASLTLLALVGYQANTAIANGPDQILWLRIFYCILPAMVMILPVVLLMKYPLNATRHRAFQNWIERRGIGSTPD